MTGSNRHVAYVLKRFPRISETFIAAEILELERQGGHVTVFALSDPKEPYRHAFLAGLAARVVYLPHRPARQPVRTARALWRILRASPRGWLLAARASLWPPRLTGARRLLQATVLWDEMTRARVDHAHAHFATAAARIANLAWRMGGPTYSVTAHAKDIYHREVKPDHLRDKLGHATFVATVSEANRRYLDSLVADRTRLHVVPNAVDLRRLGEVGERRREEGLVLSVARLVEKKGLPDLVEACALLRARGLEPRLEIAGDGPLRSELERGAREAGLEATFHGALPHEQVIGLYRRAAVFCLPCVVASTGDRDGLPTSLLEAMALGVPVVTTGVSGLSEAVVPGVTGLVVPEHDPEAIADALARLLRDPDLGARLAAAARERVEEQFDLRVSVARLRALLEESCAA
jgi:colanic acid/amylovoran biosynthesis glycosyltransferase